MMLTKLEKFLAFFRKEMLNLKFKIMLKPYFYLYLTLLFKHVDNDDANIDENHTDIFNRQTNIKDMKYHKENNFNAMGRFEFQIIVSH